MSVEDDGSPAAESARRISGIKRRLRELGGDVNGKDAEGQTLLHRACSRGEAESVRFLLDQGADVNARETRGYRWTPLYRACLEGRAEVVRLLLERGADANLKDVDGDAPLHLFIATLEIMRSLIELGGADVNIKNDEGGTPLLHSCSRGSLEEVQLLLEHGADASITDVQGHTPLCYMLYEMPMTYRTPQPQLCSILVLAYPSAVHKLPLQPLQSLVTAFPEALHTATASGDLPIHEACRNGVDASVIEFMIQQDNGSASQSNHAGRLALHEACAGGGATRRRVLERLVRAHPESAAAADNEGRLPLHLACIFHVGEDAFRYLLEQRPPSAGARDAYGKTPLRCACETNAPLGLLYMLVRKNPAEAIGLFVPRPPAVP